jgi:hypothetical protein
VAWTPDGASDVWGSAGGGMIFHWNGTEWTPTGREDVGLRDLVVATDDSGGLAVGGGGAVYELTRGEWTRQQMPTGGEPQGRRPE